MSLRRVVVGCQAATILITWPLWQVRDASGASPMLPLSSFAASIPFAEVLLASLALVLFKPGLGVAVHVALLGLAIVGDQMREQPQVLSLALLLVATLPLRGARALGALHLVALWFWSGIGKLASPRFMAEGGSWLLAGHAAPESLPATACALLLGAGEVVIAVLALLPRTRVRAAACACAMHLAILLYLSFVVRNVNPGVWPWNLALARAALTLLGTRSPGQRAVSFQRSAWLPWVAAALFVALPLGDQTGFVDAPFGHRVYTQAGPHALLLRADGGIERPGVSPSLRVAIPPVPRVLAAWFERVGRPGDRLLILEERRPARALGARDRMLVCPDGDQ